MLPAMGAAAPRRRELRCNSIPGCDRLPHRACVRAVIVVTNNGSAEIVNMEDARARRRASELEADDFPTAAAHLKAVRETAGLSLAEVSERTHIKPVYLESIEAMTLDGLPSRPFAIGFVRVYAEALGLDAPAVTARFKQDAGWAAPAEVDAERFAPVRAVAAETDRPQMSLWAVLAVIAFILWCAVQIATTTHDKTTPFNLNGARAGADSVVIPPAMAAPSGAARLAPAEAGDGPVLLERVSAVYPTRCELGAAAVETVEVAFNVTAQGVVSGARVAVSSNSCFNDAALNAARRWRFEPRRVDGAARPAYDQRYTFRFERPV